MVDACATLTHRRTYLQPRIDRQSPRMLCLCACLRCAVGCVSAAQEPVPATFQPAALFSPMSCMETNPNNHDVQIIIICCLHLRPFHAVASSVEFSEFGHVSCN